jgi:ADP-ribose pyrophosphatase YjhB (NUDIX family)
LVQGYPEAAVGALIVILDLQGEILLVKSSKLRSKYTVSGGHIELVRGGGQARVKEEVGLDVESVRVFLVREAISTRTRQEPPDEAL